METTVNNIQIQNYQIAAPDLNYGQLDRWKGYQKLKFISKFTYTEFEEKISFFFEKFILEEKKDNFSKEDEQDFPDLFEFRQKQFPSYSFLLQNDKDLLRRVLLYLEYDLVHTIYNEFENAIFSLQKLEDIKFTEDFIILQGIAFYA